MDVLSCCAIHKGLSDLCLIVYPGGPGQSQVEGERKSHAIEAYWWDRPDPSGRDVGGGGIVRSSTTKLIYRREKFSADFYRITDVENI